MSIEIAGKRLSAYRWSACITIAFSLIACNTGQLSLPESGDRPMRIVSLDYCADQYVLKLADRAQILAISPDGTKEFSYMREAATGLPTVKPVAEDVLILKPDLIVRSYGGGPNASVFFQQAGVPVLQVGFTSSIDGKKTGTIPDVIHQMAQGLGQEERGQSLIAEFRERLAAVTTSTDSAKALYMTPSGYTSGSGSLIHEMLIAAGFENFEKRSGWHPIPLEHLAYEQPEVVVAAFFELLARHPSAWSAARHPVARAQLTGPHVVPLQGAWTACGGWFLLDAIEALVASRRG